MKTRKTFPIRTIWGALAVILALSLAGQMNAQPTETTRSFGDVRVLGTVPASTGFPEGIAVRGNKIYVSGPARFGTAGDATPSRVFAFDIDSGALLTTYDIQDEDLNQDHANSCIAFDGEGRLYVVNLQLGIVRLDLGTGQQEVYAAPLPNLQPCSSVAPGTPCSPTFLDSPPLGNDIAFDEDGNPDGTEAARLHNDQDPIFPYDSPANIAFNKQGSIVLTNHAFLTMIPGHFVVLDVFVDDKESNLVKP